jgi:drug/metabolite transporter (DMT)-like permease
LVFPINLIGFVLYLLAIKKMPAAEYQMIYILSPIVVGFSRSFSSASRSRCAIWLALP